MEVEWGGIPLTSEKEKLLFLPALHKEIIQERSVETGP